MGFNSGFKGLILGSPTKNTYGSNLFSSYVIQIHDDMNSSSSLGIAATVKASERGTDTLFTWCDNPVIILHSFISIQP